MSAGEGGREGGKEGRKREGGKGGREERGREDTLHLLRPSLPQEQVSFGVKIFINQFSVSLLFYHLIIVLIWCWKCLVFSKLNYDLLY